MSCKKLCISLKLFVVILSFWFFFFCVVKDRLTQFHRFSMGLICGDWADHPKIRILIPVNHYSTHLEMCLGSLSCWYFYIRGILSTYDIRQHKILKNISINFFDHSDLNPISWTKSVPWETALHHVLVFLLYALERVNM